MRAIREPWEGALEGNLMTEHKGKGAEGGRRASRVMVGVLSRHVPPSDIPILSRPPPGTDITPIAPALEKIWCDSKGQVRHDAATCAAHAQRHPGQPLQ